MPINERILNEEDLENQEEDQEETYQVKSMLPEYGELEIPKSWSKPPALVDLKHDIEYAIIEHDEIVEEIGEHLDFYHTTPGVGRPYKVKGRSNAQPQSIRKAAEWRYGSLSEPFLDSPDLFKGAPTTHLDIEGTAQTEKVLNFQMRNQIDIVSFIEDYIKDLVDTGTAIIRTSWEVKEISKEVEQDIVKYEEAPELQPIYAKLIQLMEDDPQEFKKTVPPDIAQAIVKSIEQNTTLRRTVVRTEKSKVIEQLKNQPKLDICDYRDVIPDPTCRGIQEDMMFCGYRLRTTKAELMKDSRYSNVEEIVVAAASALIQEQSLDSTGEEIGQDSDTFQFKDPNRQPIEGIEYWGYVDVDGSGILTPVVFTWFGDILVRAEENPYPDKEIPFTFVPYLKKRNSLYGEPDGALLTEEQKISGAITRGVIDILAKNANGQRGIPKGALDYSNLMLYREGKDYEYNPTAQIGKDGLTTLTKFPEIPQSAIAIQQLAEGSIKEMTGTMGGEGSQNQGNALGTQPDQPQQAGMSKAARRELGILRRISNGIIKVGHKICAMNKEFLNDEEIIRVTDESFIRVNRTDLDCKYDLSLSISTAEDDATKAQELAFMLQTSTGVMDQGFVRMLLADIADLRRMPDKAKLYRDYEPEPDPMQEAIKKLEMQKLEAEIREINSRIEENQAEAERERANANKMGADARLSDAKADAIDLKYVEDDSGLTHERELEKQMAQAQGNMQLESHKAALEDGRIESDRENEAIDKLLDQEQEDLTDRENIGTTDPQAEVQDEIFDPEAPTDEEIAQILGTPSQLENELNQLGSTDELLEDT